METIINRMQNTYSKSGLVLDISGQKLRETGRNMIRDRSRHMNHGMCIGTNIIQTKEGICALSFNGVNNYVNCGNDTSLNSTEAITVEIWTKFDVATAGDSSALPLISRGSAYLLRRDEEISSGYISFFINDGTNWEPRVNSQFSPTVGVWFHVVGTYNRQHLKIYINGKLKGSVTRTGAINISNSSTVMDYFNSTMRFKGLIDEVRIYDRALSAEEVRGNMFTSKRYRYMRGV